MRKLNMDRDAVKYLQDLDAKRLYRNNPESPPPQFWGAGKGDLSFRFPQNWGLGGSLGTFYTVSKQYKQVASKMLSLLADATPGDYSQLKGSSYYRVNSGEYRIIYYFDAETVYIDLIGKRNGDEVYEKSKRKG